MQLYVALSFLLWYAVAEQDTLSDNSNLSYCQLLNGDPDPECRGPGIQKDTVNDKTSLPIILQEEDKKNKSATPATESLESFVMEAKCGRRTAVSSQQATELVVSRWNDLTTWDRRNDTSSICEQDVERAIMGYITNEIWALQMFDAWAKPGPSLLEGRSKFSGNYYQCRDTRAPKSDRRAGFMGNYCVVTLANLTNTYKDYLVDILTVSNIEIGTCLPDSCSQDEIIRLFDEKIQRLNISRFLKATSVDCRTDEREYTTFTKIAILIVLLIGTLTFFGTCLELAILYCPNWWIQSSQDEKDQITAKDKQPKISTGFWSNVLLSFSAYTNGQRLLSTSQAPGSISVIPGIRFLTMSWIVIGHTFFILMYTEASNSFQGLNTMIRMRASDMFLNMPFGVDSFFTISGFLVSYLTVRQVIAKGWKFDWKHFFLHRYWRLTPSYMVTFVLIQGLQRFAVAGTMAPTMQPMDKVACEKTWWRLPLYINNLFAPGLDDSCFAQSWSLAADFQFYLLSPLMLIPFHYHKYAGFASCLLFIVVQWVIAGITSYKLNAAISMLRNTIDYNNYVYYPFYTRTAPFAIGILCGYILSINGGRVNMNKCTVVTGWVVAITTALVLIFGFHGDLTGESLSSLLVASIYHAVVRSVWAAVVCWIIIACTSRYGGPITAFLSWPAFTVLGRLTYIGYLVHICVMTVIFQNLEQPTHLSFYSVVIFGVIDVVFTCIVSAVLVVCVEFPTLNLEKVLRSKK